MNLFQILACDQALAPVINLVKALLGLVQMGIPIILIVLGSIDLGKAVISSDEKEIKAATGKLIKRCVAAVAVFFVTAIVTLVMNLVADSGVSGGDSWKDCWNQGTGAADRD